MPQYELVLYGTHGPLEWHHLGHLSAHSTQLAVKYMADHGEYKIVVCMLTQLTNIPSLFIVQHLVYI
jgi:hypothetical protein